MIHPMTTDSWKTLIEQIGLLYQEYRDKSTLHEIETRRLQDSQTDPEECSANEETPSEAEPTNTTENRTFPQISLLRNPTSRFNLWQDLPEIRSSGVLNILQPDEIKLQEAMFELVTSEASYYKSLNLLVSHFMENERLKKILHPSEAHILFSNVLDVMAVSERFLLDLEQRVEENIVISDVCDIVYQHTVNHFSVYVTYVSNQTYQERAYKQLLQDKTAFREVISQLEMDPKCKGLPFSSFLILPFQRITRLKLLVQNILKKVEEKSEKETTALEAHKELEIVVKACNEGVRKMSRTEQMISIQKKLEFKIKSVPIISHSRWLLKQGELQQMNGPKTSRTLRTKKLFREIYLFLFNDLLVLCRQIPGEKYQVFDSAPRGLLRVEELEDQGQSLANVFILRLLENTDDREVSYMLKASSQSEMKRWMISLAPNRRTKFVSFTSRLMDCPQVQCVHPYVAQQPDELSLELADVLNILDKTDDGWIFGERLHDQERGWFPSSMGEEILNPKIRSQNLKECFRVAQGVPLAYGDGGQMLQAERMRWWCWYYGPWHRAWSFNMLIPPTPKQIDSALLTEFSPPHFVFLWSPTQERIGHFSKVQGTLQCNGVPVVLPTPENTQCSPLCSEELLDKTASESRRRVTAAVTYQGCLSHFSSINGQNWLG
nr:ephexin-1 isoform X3 [Pelodiscus sinensis]|eukprot:XP_006123734.1 ephexin-1 isoform X3 [Pelodiscus sinensis]